MDLSSPERFRELRTQPVKGDLDFEEGARRRGPSEVIRVGELYCVDGITGEQMTSGGREIASHAARADR